MKRYVFGKKGRLSENVRLSVVAAAIIAIVILLNAVIGLLPLRTDMTSEGLYSLSAQSNRILSEIDESVTITCLFDRYSLPSGDRYIEITGLLDEYAKHDNITVEYIDPDASPGIISRLDPSGMNDLKQGSFAVKCGNRLRALSSSDLFTLDIDYATLQTSLTETTAEQAFTGAITYVASKEVKTVWLMQGHGEDDAEKAYSTVMGYISSGGFEFKTLNLMTDGLNLGNRDVLMCIAPKTDLSKDELDMMREYMRNGGKAVLMFRALDTSDEFENWNELLSVTGISINSDLVIEKNSAMFAAGEPNSFISYVKDDAGELAGGEESIVLAHNARSISILDNKKDYINARGIMYTSETARSVPVDRSGKYADGSHLLGAAVEARIGEEKTRAVVLGTAGFASDEVLGKYTSGISNYNIKLLTDSVSWVRGDDSYDAVPAREYSDGRILITGAQANTASIILIGVIPAVILAMGVFVFIRRRHL